MPQGGLTGKIAHPRISSFSDATFMDLLGFRRFNVSPAAQSLKKRYDAVWTDDGIHFKRAMAVIGYHASHEQFSPQELLTYVKAAETAGFKAAMSSDHLVPWSVRQGNSGFAWTWLGAAMQTTQLPFGSLAIPTDGRYHPAIVAQAAATLCDLFPRRFQWIAAGSGEAMNEKALGRPWPDKAGRNALLLEGVSIIRKLWSGDTVSTRTGLIQTDNLKLWSLPRSLPKIYGAALSSETANWMGKWADGLITVYKPAPEMREIIKAFEDGGGRGKPMVLQFQLSWAETRQVAIADAWDQWRCCALDAHELANLATPEQFDAATAHLTIEDFDVDLCASEHATDHIDWIRQYQAMGFSEIYLHNRGRNQLDFINFFGREVLPALG